MAVAGVLIFATYQIGLVHAGTLSNLLIAAGGGAGGGVALRAGRRLCPAGRYTYTRWPDVVKDGLRVCLGCPAARWSGW